MLTQARLKELFSYDPETGLFTRLINVSRAKAGDIAGTKLNTGYISIVIDQKPYLAHRLAWLWTYGEMPDGLIDHRNHAVDDNRISNLRLADKSKNAQNAKRQSNNTSGHKGVHFHKPTGKWIARVNLNGKTHYLGVHARIEDAVSAAERKRIELHGEFARHA